MLPANRAFSSDGAPIAGAVAYLYSTGTLTPATFYADNALSIPLGTSITANAAGRFPTAYQNGDTPFRLILKDEEGATLDDIDPFYFGQVYGSSIPPVATRALLAVIPGSANSMRYLSESGREGIFVWDSANLSAKVSADTAQGIYVAPSSDTTGASGAWVREYDGRINVKWFGALGDGVTNDAAAIQAAEDFIYNANGGGTLYFPAAIYQCTAQITKRPFVNWEGDGRTRTVLRWPASHTGHGLRLNSGLNGGGTARLTIRDMGFEHQGGAADVNLRGGFYDTGSHELTLDNIGFAGWKYGVILDQSEEVDFYEFYVASSKHALWIVNGEDTELGNTGSSPTYTNAIRVHSGKFSSNTDVNVIDDGGDVHVFANINCNAGTRFGRFAGVTTLTLGPGLYLEGMSDDYMLFANTARNGGSVGVCSTVRIQGSQAAPAVAKTLVNASSAGRIIIGGNNITGTTPAVIVGAANCSGIVSDGGNITDRAITDGSASFFTHVPETLDLTVPDDLTVGDALTVTGAAQFNGAVNVGTAASVGSASPNNINLGGTYSTSAGANPKAYIYNDGSGQVGLGVSSGQFDYIATSTFTHNFYIAGTLQVTVNTSGINLASGKTLSVAGTQVVGAQGAAVSDLTTTATAGTLPTADGAVTIANAASPTVTELLEYCVELEAKLETLLARVRAHGLIAT